MMEAARHTGRILIIDDNPAIHADIRKILKGRDVENDELELTKALLFDEEPVETIRTHFQLDSAYQGQEGLEMVQRAIEEGDPYAVAFVDVRMPPGWDGVETIGHLWKSYPELQVVICTAYSDYSWEEMIRKLGMSPSLVVLKKPFDNVEVLQLAHALTDKWHLNRKLQSQLVNLDVLVRQRTSELETANEQLKKEIAARIEAEGVMRLSEERFSKAFHATPIPLAIQSLNKDELIDANEAFLRMIAGSRNQVVGFSPDELQMWPEPEFTTALMESLRDNPCIRNRPCLVRNLHGQQRNALLSIEPFESGAGPHLLIIIQDITDQLKLENELRQSQKMEAVGQLAAGVAHDFNNILTAIHGHASLLQNQLSANPTQSRSLTVISLAAERATRLVRQLLTFSRKQVLKPQVLHLDQVASNMAEMLHHVLGDHITLSVTTEGRVAPVKADVSMMEQIILNLSVNARDAMPRGGQLTVHVRSAELSADDVRKHADVSPGHYVCLSVRDTGSGIPREHLSRVFDPFFTTKEIGKGTGLGLATVYGIVKQHQGCIDIETEVGKGTVFHLYFPAEVDTQAPSKPVNVPVPPAPGHECILVVEDEDMVRSMASSILRGAGYRVLEAGSGKEALEVFDSNRSAVALLFTDVMMPGNLLGDELATRIRSARPEIPVLFTSGYTPELMDVQLRNDSMFLAKPFTPSQLLTQVRSCLDRSRLSSAPAA